MLFPNFFEQSLILNLKGPSLSGVQQAPVLSGVEA